MCIHHWNFLSFWITADGYEGFKCLRLNLTHHGHQRITNCKDVQREMWCGEGWMYTTGFMMMSWHRCFQHHWHVVRGATSQKRVLGHLMFPLIKTKQAVEQAVKLSVIGDAIMLRHRNTGWFPQGVHSDDVIWAPWYFQSPAIRLFTSQLDQIIIKKKHQSSALLCSISLLRYRLCRKNFSKWQRSFQWKLRCHWFKGLRHSNRWSRTLAFWWEEFYLQSATNAEGVFILWHHNVFCVNLLNDKVQIHVIFVQEKSGQSAAEKFIWSLCTYAEFCLKALLALFYLHKSSTVDVVLVNKNCQSCYIAVNVYFWFDC